MILYNCSCDCTSDSDSDSRDSDSNSSRMSESNRRHCSRIFSCSADYSYYGGGSCRIQRISWNHCCVDTVVAVSIEIEGLV